MSAKVLVGKILAAVLAAYMIIALLLAATQKAWGVEDVYSDTLILVNQENQLPAYLEPEDLVSLTSFVRGNGNVRLRQEAADALQLMLADLRAAGITDYYISSAYRNYGLQSQLYTNRTARFRNEGYGQEEAERLAARWVLPPGQSEHQTGLVVDISTASINYAVEGVFATTATGQWLAAHSPEYGFIIRYTAEKQEITGVNPEPWHFRYVGVEHAQYMTRENLCLEEYHARLREEGFLVLGETEEERRVVYYSDSDNSAELPGTVVRVSLARKNSGEYITTIIPHPEPLFDTLGHWGELNIRRLYDLELVSGYPDGTYRPEGQVSRAEFVTILSRLGLEDRYLWPLEPLPEEDEDESDEEEETADGAEEEAAEDADDEQDEDSDEDTDAEDEDGEEQPILPEIPEPLPYLDIDQTAYYYQPLEACYRAGLLQALELPGQETLFQPTQPLLRAEAALVLAAFFDDAYFELPARNTYSDVPFANRDLARAVEYLTFAGIFQGGGDGLFGPEREISRAELATMLCRMLDLAEEIEQATAEREAELAALAAAAADDENGEGSEAKDEE